YWKRPFSSTPGTTGTSGGPSRPRCGRGPRTRRPEGETGLRSKVGGPRSGRNPNERTFGVGGGVLSSGTHELYSGEILPLRPSRSPFLRRQRRVLGTDVAGSAVRAVRRRPHGDRRRRRLSPLRVLARQPRRLLSRPFGSRLRSKSLKSKVPGREVCSYRP